MKSEQQKVQQGVEVGIITQGQADQLVQLWAAGQADVLNAAGSDSGERASPMSNFLYYLGALVVIGAMSWLMNTAWDVFKGFGLFFIAAGYAAVFCLVSRYFREKSTVISGLFVVMAVCMTPLGVFGLQSGLDLWPGVDPGSYSGFYRYIKGGWFTMEVATIAAGLISLRYSRIPFAMAPIAFALWFMSMDVAPLLVGPDVNWDARKIISMGFGLAMIAAALVIQRQQQVDYAKWLYIFGAMAFWGGLSLLRSDSELSKFLYCLINVFMMFCGVLLERRVFVIFGGLGFFGYLGYLSWNVFKNSLLFPFWLTGLGLAIVYLGWVFHRKYDVIRDWARRVTPQWILERLPKQ